MAVLVLVKGAGDLATGVAHRLHRSGFRVLMTELAQPTVVRRTVSFAEVIYDGRQDVGRRRLPPDLRPRRGRGGPGAGRDPGADRPGGGDRPATGARWWWTPSWPSGSAYQDHRRPGGDRTRPGFHRRQRCARGGGDQPRPRPGAGDLTGRRRTGHRYPAPISGSRGGASDRSPADGVFARSLEIGARVRRGCGRLRRRLSCVGPDRRRVAGADRVGVCLCRGQKDGRR